MAIQHLSDEQVRTMTLREKDEWWLKNVYRGDLPQLTIRSALTGMLLGGVLSLTNLYVGIRTGWTLGVGITSVILAFSLFKILSSMRICKDMTILENNAMQSIATAAGYMTSPLIASVPAYMLVNNTVIPLEHTIIWMVLLAILGVLFAFPLKKRFINEEQMPFPEGRAAGVVMDNLYSNSGPEGMFKAKILIGGGVLAAVIEFLRNHTVLEKLRLAVIAIPEHWDAFLYKFFTPAIMGTPLKDLTIRFDTSIIMVGAGGLMGIKTGFSLLLGGILNYAILAPYLIKEGIIAGPGFKNITIWALWGGVAMMTTSSLFAFFAKPQVLIASFGSLFSKRRPGSEDVLKDIELPMWVSLIGVPIVGAAVVYTGHLFFDFSVWLGIIAIPLVFVFTLISVTSTGLTSITPIGALGKLTQLTFSVIAPGNIPTNIMAAGINAEVSGHASNLIMDIKPGYMLGAKPRQQAVGHVLGIIAGAAVSVPVYYMLFNNDLSLLTSEKLPMPAAQIWRAVAEVLAKGLGFLHPSAQLAIVVGAVFGVVFEVLNTVTKGRFPISAMGFGLAFVLAFNDCLTMGLGSIFFWLMAKALKDPKATLHRIFVSNQETLCAGVIAGGALIGILLIILETFVLV